MLLQLGGSLVAILALTGLAVWLKLGGQPTIADAAEAAKLAGESMDGFAPVASAVSDDGTAALLRNAEGRILLLAPHGNRFYARLLTGTARTEPTDRGLRITAGERWLRPVDLVMRPHIAEDWIAAIARLD